MTTTILILTFLRERFRVGWTTSAGKNPALDYRLSNLIRMDLDGACWVIYVPPLHLSRNQLEIDYLAVPSKNIKGWVALDLTNPNSLDTLAKAMEAHGAY